MFPQVACFQGGTGELNASALRDSLDVPAAALPRLCVGCVDG